MFKLFSKSCLIGILSLSAMNASLVADCYDPCESSRTYIGAFGGGMNSNTMNIAQVGTAFFTEDDGGALAVDARGRAKSTWSGFGGVQLGYEWTKPFSRCSCWSFSTAVELEGYWYCQNKKADLVNPVDTDRLHAHDFYDTFHMNAGVYLANAVFSLNHSNFESFSPYLGLGVGATRISLKHATSLQTVPPEPLVNHFNSNRNDASWAFAAQIKAGIRYNFCKSFHVFGEYRYLFVDYSNYMLGSTVYPELSHVPTSPWDIRVKDMQYNAFVFGIQYDL